MADVECATPNKVRNLRSEVLGFFRGDRRGPDAEIQFHGHEFFEQGGTALLQALGALGIEPTSFIRVVRERTPGVPETVIVGVDYDMDHEIDGARTGDGDPQGRSRTTYDLDDGGGVRHEFTDAGYDNLLQELPPGADAKTVAAHLTASEFQTGIESEVFVALGIVVGAMPAARAARGGGIVPAQA